ncbi:CHASE2 domain-containing protein [Roseateles sp.]|uniref:CHASE2 domain-containing protein n=1 Tax=Roseateles sp. TaxID=1971397 RepID=UPI003BA703DF
MAWRESRALQALRAMSREQRRFLFEWLTLCLLALAATVVLTLQGWGAGIGHLLFDSIQRWQPAQAGTEVVIIAIDDASIEELGGWPIRRDTYAQLLEQLADPRDKPRAIGIDILFHDERPEDAQMAQPLRKHRAFLAMEYRPPAAGQAAQARQPGPLLTQAATGLAHINLAFESDGFIRGAHLRAGTVPHLALAMSGTELDSSGGNSYRRFKLVDPAQGFPTVRMSDVVQQRVPKGLFKDRYVLIGSTAPSLGDHYPTIYSGRQGAGTPGVELHASLLQDILNDELIESASKPWRLAYGAIAVCLVLLGLLTLSPLVELLLSAAVLLGAALFSVLVLREFSLWIDPSPLLIVVLLLKPAWAWRRLEMIVAFMSGRARLILPSPKRETVPLLQRLQTDTVLQTSRLLDQAIESVRARTDFLKSVLDGAPSPMMVVDEGGQVAMVNARIEEDFPAEFVALHVQVGAMLNYLGLSQRLPQELLGAPHYVSVSHTNGSERHYMLRAAALSVGPDSLWLLALADVTEMRSLQLQRDMTLQLLSHDMRTPVASIIALCRRTGPLADPSAMETLLGVQRHANKLLRLMDDFILSIAAESSRYQMSEAVFEFLLDEAMDQVQDLAQSRQIRIEIEPSAEPVFINCDQRLMVRVLVNLLVNAVRHGQMGSVVSISQHVSIEAGDERHVECWIKNHVATQGTHTNADPAARGFGLGREFVSNVVRRHGGQVTFSLPESPGQLAEVRLRLPLTSTLAAME